MIKNFLLLWSLLDKKNKLRSLFVVFIAIISALFEMLSLGLIFPVLDYSISVNTIPDYQILKMLYLEFNFNNKKDFIVFLFFGIFVIFLFKNIILITLNFFKFKFISYLRHFFSSSLYIKFISESYLEHISRNSNEVINNLTVLINTLKFNVLYSFSIFISEMFVTLFLVLLCIVLNPYGSLVLFSLILILSLIFYLIFTPILKKFGYILQENESLRIKNINESIYGIKDIKIFNYENEFINKYNRLDFMIAKSQTSFWAINNSSSYILELILIISISFYILIETFNDLPFNSLLPIIAIYGVVAFRLIPSLNRIISSSQSIKYADFVFDKIYNELKNTIKKKHEKTPKSFNNYIQLINFCFSYDKKTPLLKNLNLKIFKNDIIGIYGKTGSGKSTFLNLFLGLIKPSKGDLIVDGKKFHSITPIAGYVPQDIFLLNDTILNNVAFNINPKANINISRVKQSLIDAQLSEFIDLRDGINTVVGDNGIRISGGQKQRLGIARVLYNNPSIIIFDEATSALDYRTEANIMKTIFNLRNKYTIIIVAHRTNTLALCNSIYELKDQSLHLSTL